MSQILLSVLLLATSATAAAADSVQIPGGANLDLELATPIDERATPTDTEIAFKLNRELKKDRTPLVPKGAAVIARVARIQKHSSFIRNTKRTYFIVGLQMVRIKGPDGAIPVLAQLETVGPTNTTDYFIPFSHGPDRWGPFEEYRFQFRIPEPQAGESFLGVVREYLRVPKGLRMVFRTPDSH